MERLAPGHKAVLTLSPAPPRSLPSVGAGFVAGEGAGVQVPRVASVGAPVGVWDVASAWPGLTVMTQALVVVVQVVVRVAAQVVVVVVQVVALVAVQAVALVAVRVAVRVEAPLMVFRLLPPHPCWRQGAQSGPGVCEGG
jgi:hypothetical protein